MYMEQGIFYGVGVRKAPLGIYPWRYDFATLPSETVASNRSRMLEYRKKQRADQNLERRARRNELEVDIENVNLEHLASGALFRDIFQAADLYGVYEDLFGIDIMFRPCVDIKLRFDYDDEYVTPVFRGT